MTLLKLSSSGGVLILWIVVLRFCAMNKLPKKVFMLMEDSAVSEDKKDNNSVKDNAASEENNDGGNELIKYKKYGVRYDSSKGIWMYKGQQIAGLIDGGDVYIDGRDVANLVYLQISNGTVKVITEKRFNTLAN